MHIFTKVYKIFYYKQLHIVLFNIFIVGGKIFSGFAFRASTTEMKFFTLSSYCLFLTKLDTFSKGYQDIDDKPKE